MNEENVKKETTEYLIVKSNDLIQTTAFRLTNAQYDLLNYMVMKIKPTDTDLYPQIVNIQDYCRVMGISTDDNYAYIRKTAKELADKSVWGFIEDENGNKVERVLRWIEDPIMKRGQIIIQLKPYWKPYLVNVGQNFTKLVIQETAPMKSVYGKRTYELLKSHSMNRQGRVITRIDIDEYKRLMLGNEDCKKKYKQFNNFRNKVIDTAMKDMEMYGDLNVSYKLIKEGYSYKYIEFVVEERTLSEKLEVWERERNARKNNAK